jgi:hypothetical protein
VVLAPIVRWRLAHVRRRLFTWTATLATDRRDADAGVLRKLRARLRGRALRVGGGPRRRARRRDCSAPADVQLHHPRRCAVRRARRRLVPRGRHGEPGRRSDAEGEGIDRAAADAETEVEVRTGRAAGRTRVEDEASRSTRWSSPTSSERRGSRRSDTSWPWSMRT